MKHRTYLITFLATATFTHTSAAEEPEIYKSEDKQGVVEFSDQPAPDAQLVDLEKPNVVKVVPVEVSIDPEIEETTRSVDPAHPTENVYRDNHHYDGRYTNPVQPEKSRRERRDGPRDHKQPGTGQHDANGGGGASQHGGGGGGGRGR